MLFRHSMSIAQQRMPIYNSTVHKNKVNVALNLMRLTVGCLWRHQQATRSVFLNRKHIIVRKAQVNDTDLIDYHDERRKADVKGCKKEDRVLTFMAEFVNFELTVGPGVVVTIVAFVWTNVWNEKKTIELKILKFSFHWNWQIKSLLQT